jgi:gamma-glutamylcyclotransferase (GGCT)/AIG2-like uncharacterized protein YtfP
MTIADAQLPFFAYGTLLPGEANFDLWREAIVDYCPAVLRGALLYDLGYFPMLVDAPTGEARGLLVTIRPRSYLAALTVLDMLEGTLIDPFGRPAYRRARRVVHPEGRPAAVAWVYIGNPLLLAGLEPLGTDWKTHSRRPA